MVLLKRSIAWLLILVPVFTFFWFFLRYTVDVPVNDDYPAILLFLNNFLSTSSLHEKLKLIFSQHNEHRIVYCRLWSLLYYMLDKPINFNVLGFIGNLSIAGIGLIFFRRFLRLGKSLFLFIPVSVLLFNLTSSENMLYSMCALSNFPVYVFILLCLLFVTSSSPSGNTKILLGALFFLLSVLTSGAGIMLFPVTLGILIYKKQYRHLLINGSIASLIMLLYFYGYVKPVNSGRAP